jgi:hypothetical protein
MQKRIEQEREERMRQIRFNGRRCVDELIRPILNLDIVEQFSTEENKNFDHVPL